MSDSASTPKTKKPTTKKPSEHPKYEEMISAAIKSLSDRKGSSRQAIVKYIQTNYKVGDSPGKHVKLALKRGVINGKFLQVKGTGASGSFKLIKQVTEKKTKNVTKVAAKKPAAKKPSKPAAKKPAQKKKAEKSKKKADKPKKKSEKAKSPAKKVVKKVIKKKSVKKTPTKAAAKKPAKKAPAKKTPKKSPAKKGKKSKK